IGIPPNEIDKIFNKFYKIPSPSPEKKKGSGLGLSFVKQVIDKHNGKIYVESTPGQGSVFGFTLPL
ncbi:MAG TPA: ATP-binding protein, partial [Calditrichaeota bacterium]|nr:ATP-binding protein [Calditrichota bacterium]